MSSHEELGTITLEKALEIFKKPKERGRSGSKTTISELGEHPDSKVPIRVKDGRFGPYATDGVVNATIPKGRDPKSITLEDALDLIAAREQKLLDQGKDPRAPKAKKATRKKTTKKKVTKKKTAKKKVSKTKKIVSFYRQMNQGRTITTCNSRFSPVQCFP